MLCYVVLCYINSRILLNDSWPCPTIKIQPLTMAHLLSKLRPRPGHPLRKPPSPGWYDKPLGHINRSFPNFLLILLDTRMILQFGNWLFTLLRVSIFTLLRVSIGSNSWILPLIAWCQFANASMARQIPATLLSDSYHMPTEFLSAQSSKAKECQMFGGAWIKAGSPAMQKGKLRNTKIPHE